MHITNNYFKFFFKKFKSIQLLCGLLVILTTTAFAQETDIRIANEYFLKGDKDKALSMYQSLSKNIDNIPAIHTNYLTLLLDLGKYKDAEDYLERLLRKTDDRISYRVDLGLVYIKSGEMQKADKYFRALIKSALPDVFKIKSIADYLAAHNLPEYAVIAIQEIRQAVATPTMFNLEMANLYRMQGKRDMMVEEYLNYLTQSPANITYVKNLLQIFLSKPDELESLEKMLFDKVQKSPDSEVYADLLIWVNLQQKNFYGAFIQARAYDKRFRKENSKTLEIAQIALNNKDYENADKSFSYVIKEFANTDNYLPARLGLIRARESKVKKNFPVNKDSVRYLTREYQSFINKYPDNANSYEAALNEALLHAYYLDEKDSAIAKLTGITANSRIPLYLKARAKLDLGDIYILREEPWDSTLLYSQVEKSQRDAPLGYEAKLRNAKLSYYKGDFKLAQEHLDILKQATTREIANDAMDLSIRIKENTTYDSTGSALKEYAAIELLLVQNKTEDALQRLKTFATTAMTSSIKDDVYWLEANLRLKRGEFEQAVLLLNKIETEFGQDILADDASFMEADIYQNFLKNNQKAMEIYRTFLDKYPGSVYAAEARKRYRKLRGDFQEKIVN